MHAAQHVVQHPVADCPLLQGVDLDCYCILEGFDVPGQRVVQHAEEPFDGIFEEVQQIRQGHVRGGRWWKSVINERRWWTALPRERLGGGERSGVEGEW